MKKVKLLTSLAVILSLIMVPCTALAVPINEERCESIISEQNYHGIDMGIWNLNYDRNAVLSSQGESVESFVPKSGSEVNGKFVVVEKNKKSLSTTPVDISIIDSITDRTYPGALQLADKGFLDNRPTLLMCKRKPIDISIDLPGMGSNNTINVKNPNYSNVSAAVDTLINNWSEKNSSSHTLPARTQYSEAMVYSLSQIGAELNVDAKTLTNSLSIDFDAISKGEKKVMVAAYKQIFYTVSASLPENPSDLFDDSVTFSELQRKGVSDSTPPLMVSNVAYGRTVYVKLETNSNSDEVEEAFKAVLKGNNVENNTKYKNILDESSFTAVVLGGDAQTHNKVVTKDFDEIRNIIKDNAEFSIKNPGYPMSYTSVFLKDNSLAAVNNRTEYIETKSTEYTRGKINLDHYGAYVAQFDISWDEFNYDENGNEVLVHKTWDGNWEDKTAHFSTVIPLPANAKNIRIYGRECTGLAWEWWRDVINEYNVPLTNQINVEMGGTTLYPYGSVQP